MHSSYPSNDGNTYRTPPSSRSMNLGAVSHSRSLWPIEQSPSNYYEQQVRRDHSSPLYSNQFGISHNEPYAYRPVLDDRGLPSTEYYAFPLFSLVHSSYRNQYYETGISEQTQRCMSDQSFFPMNPYPNFLPSSRLDNGSFSNPVRRAVPRRPILSAHSLPLSDPYLSPLPYADERPRSAQSDTLPETFPALLSPPSSRQSPHIQRLGSACLRSLLDNPLYLQLWNGTYAIECQQILRIISRNTPIHSLGNAVTRQCILFKKQCNVNKSRSLFLQFLVANPLQTQTWIEFTRMEMETGCYDNALCVIDTALIALPGHTLLITKKLRILERVCDISGIMAIVACLRSNTSQRATSVLLDAAQALARLGQDQSSWIILHTVCTNPECYSGRLYLELLRYCSLTLPFSDTLNLLCDILDHYPKHAPLWSFCMMFLERAVASFISAEFALPEKEEAVYNKVTELACQILPHTVLWKVYYERVRRDVHLINYYHNYYYFDIAPETLNSIRHSLQMLLFQDARMTLSLCPGGLRWKVLLLLSHSAIVIGYRQASRSFMKRGLRRCPQKFRHHLVLEYSKTLYFTGSMRLSTSILSRSLLQFPDEWKLILECANQLLYGGHLVSAYRLCQRSIERYVGAGRLWSLFIHISHILFGPEEALHCFRLALRHVAKSGEVWCEGARVFLDPFSSHFSPSNALKALNYSAFFTPQYGDILIEGLRLLMITSNTFLIFHGYDHRCLEILLSSNPVILDYCQRSSFMSPNYGSLWFQCMERSYTSSSEVLLRASRIIAKHVAREADVYFEAMKRCALYHRLSVEDRSMLQVTPLGHRHFASALIHHDELFKETPSSTVIRSMKILYGSIPLDAN